ncbi:MAG: bifunctional (p)ppGpp synthetase/guanosine-3',5'-bis(diphosphate) 3'-pyrophosphohydrolase [Defluviitaleaceae bacterium]|nr:bifunctional (p)ppGpp synthetase/guanosine-3',5'-bis(diphosphate) 3'-pyrophosphohydrolase [Defluviitaleaceae bacterium]
MANSGVIAQAYENLVTEIKVYRPDLPLYTLEAAYKLAVKAHEGQFRSSGEPFVVHPLSVAKILAEIRTDMESIIAAILHDVVEDTDYDIEDIKQQFGEDVALIVDGVTKIEKVAYTSKTDEQAENYRKMFFHMAQDVRVLLVKIADRLHNMRTLDARPEHKQVIVARETLDIYAPLAHRLGIAKLRYELEELGFKYHDRIFYNELAKKVEIKLAERQEIVEQLIAEIRRRLEADKIEAIVVGRPKRFYSIHKKMVSKGKALDEIYDLYAVRVLVEKASECYEVLGRLHEMYTPVPGRFKDYIGMKKPNGYQSIHTTLMGPGEPFEVQIRTHEMHNVAKFGIAAHWKYKASGKEAKDQWLQEIMDQQRNVKDNEEFLDVLKTDLSAFKGHIYCFTPENRIISLVEGACVIDFAYAVHSALGNRMIGARVNGKMVAVNHVLETGDRVEIIDSQNSKGPNRDWLKIVKSASARSKITQWFNRENRDENIRKGREALENEADEVKIPLAELLANGRETDILNRFNCRNMENLFVMIGVGGLREKLVINHLCREYEKVQPPPSDDELIKNLIDAGGKNENRKKTSGIIIKGIGDTAVRFGKCCGPLPGDEITGFVTRGRGLTVHRTDCVNVIHMDEFDRRRLLDAQWHVPEKSGHTFHTDLRMVYTDREGLMADVSRVLSEEKVKVKSMTARSIQGEAIMTMGIELADGDQLNRITIRLKNEIGAHEIERVHV